MLGSYKNSFLVIFIYTEILFSVNKFLDNHEKKSVLNQTYDGLDLIKESLSLQMMHVIKVMYRAKFILGGRTRLIFYSKNCCRAIVDKYTERLVFFLENKVNLRILKKGLLQKYIILFSFANLVWRKNEESTTIEWLTNELAENFVKLGNSFI